MHIDPAHGVGNAGGECTGDEARCWNIQPVESKCDECTNNKDSDPGQIGRINCCWQGTDSLMGIELVENDRNEYGQQG